MKTKNMIRLFFTSLLLLIFSISAFSSVRRLCKIKYETEDGWSKEHIMEVEFSTGKELNERTNTYKYDSYKKYALIWFGQGQVAILEISEYVYIPNDKFDKEGFKNLFNYRTEIKCKQINSDESRYWIIKVKDWNGFFDPRVKEDEEED